MNTIIPLHRFFRGAVLTGFCAVFLTALIPLARAIPRQVTLEAIHQVENPRNVTRPGPAGELGAYQFRPATWAQHTDRPFRDALDRRWADLVAARHYDWLCERLAKNGLEPSVYNVALAWNAGLTATVRGVAPRRSHAYAIRVGNLAADFHGRTMVASR